jgi:hypothetical protein
MPSVICKILKKTEAIMKRQILLLFVLTLFVPANGRSDERTETHRYVMQEELKDAKLYNDYKSCERALKSLLLGKYKSSGNNVEIEKYDKLVKNGLDICWELRMNDPEVKEEIKETYDQYGIKFTKELYIELIDSDVQNQLKIQGAK